MNNLEISDRELSQCIGGKHHSVWECIGGAGGAALKDGATGVAGGAAAGTVIPGIGTGTLAGGLGIASGLGGLLSGATDHCG